MVLDRQMPAHPAAVAAARRLVVATCRRAQLDEVRTEAVLLASELVSAAVSHAELLSPPSLLRLRLETGPREFSLAVSVPATCSGLADVRSHALVDTLAEEWGLATDLPGMGRALWFRLVAP